MSTYKYTNLDLYYIKHFNNPVLSFEFETEGLRYGQVKNINIYDKSLLPYYFKSFGLDNDTLLSWIRHRSIPKNRKFVNKLLESMQLDENNPRSILEITKGLSLNDVYWICNDEEKDTLSFDNINLYDNDFSETLSLIAFTGYGTRIKDVCSSPEFTTAGQLPKCWRRINNETYLYKGASSGAANTGKEPYMEYYASQIAEKMGYNHVHYDLGKWKGILASTCPIFTSKSISYVPMGYVVPTGGIDAVNKYMKSLNNDIAYKNFQQYILFTAVISNVDSHYGNFGVLVDNFSNEVIGFAPIFDNGAGLYNYALIDELEDIDKLREYAKSQNTSYYMVKYTDLVKEICNPAMTKDLALLHNFHFKKHEKYNLSDKAITNIEIITQERIIELEKALRQSKN